MREILRFTADDITPKRAVVLELQGIPADVVVSERVSALCDTAFGLFAEFVDPVGVLQEISVGEFAPVYRGEGRNEPDTPVGDIFPQANPLALFAVTLGPRISRRITDLFESNDAAVGCMLDSVASVAADELAGVVEGRYLGSLAEAGRVAPGAEALRYSPGYCGWHVSGQRALFDSLCPEAIGISLRESFLMDPLKSVSGVVLVGPRELHAFDDVYPFCAACETKGCRERTGARYSN
jgi:hypothetical protein